MKPRFVVTALLCVPSRAVCRRGSVASNGDALLRGACLGVYFLNTGPWRHTVYVLVPVHGVAGSIALSAFKQQTSDCCKLSLDTVIDRMCSEGTTLGKLNWGLLEATSDVYVTFR